jgi:hypothetical protein
LFLKLQRAHRRDGFEAMMKAGNAHSDSARGQQCDFHGDGRTHSDVADYEAGL